MNEIQQLEQAIKSLEAQRGILGNAVIDVALEPLKQKLETLKNSSRDQTKLDERKLVIVMFADLSGFTALSEKLDPEQVREIMNGCFNALVPIIERYGGTIDKFIGDEIMALFGAPIAKENDAEMALRASLEMMEALKQFNQDHGLSLGMHFGINTGVVVAGGLGSENRQQYSVMGDADNLLRFSERTHQYLMKNDVPHIYYLESGGHDFKVWKSGLYMFSKMLFKPVDQSKFNQYSLLGTPAATNIRNAKFPQILPDSRALFRIKAPEANNLQLDLGKKYDFVKGEDGMWEVTTEPLGEGFHYYSLIIDGIAVADPASETFYGMGRKASGIEVPFKGDDYYAIKDVPHGEVRKVRYFSNILRQWRTFNLYTPPGYDSLSNEKFPVLYILHGGGEDQRGWASQGKTDLILDNLIAEKKAKPMLVVMPDGNMPFPGFNENSLKMFERELLESIFPFVEKNYRVLTDSNNRALAGLSMGGLQTLYAGIQNTDLFSYLGVFSSDWFKDRQNEISDGQYEFMKTNADKINGNLKQFWISMGGKEDIAYENCKAMMAKFDEMNIKYSYREYPGGHTWPVWRNDLYTLAPLLFQE